MMRSLSDQLIQYAKYHRDPRNIATHFVGIPMIVVAITILLSRPGVELWGATVSPAWIVLLLSAFYYLALDLVLGVVMALLLAGCLWVGALVSAGSTMYWLSWGIGLFVVGWIFQFVGHYYEGKKPAFVDDIMGLVIGPLFVVAEALFLLGLFGGLRRQVEKGAGRIVKRQKTEAVSH